LRSSPASWFYFKGKGTDQATSEELVNHLVALEAF
jgi:hypothetical protein